MNSLRPGKSHHLDARYGSEPLLVSPVGSESGPPTTPGDYSDIFECANPTTPKYEAYPDRLGTYKDWPKPHVLKPEVLADAGLFYLEDRDRCKCYYCNGGLQNWVAGDNPMEEHAKYFPHCEYVLARMGPDYVAELNAKHPNLRRPTIPASPQMPAAPSPTNHDQDAHSQPPFHQAAAGRPRHNVELATLPPVEADRMQDCYGKTKLASEAAKFGFDQDTINEVLTKKYKRTGFYYSNFGDLIDDIIEYERGNPPDTQAMEVDCSENTIRWSPAPAVQEARPCDVRSTIGNQVECDSPLRNKLQSAINETLCKSCLKRSRDCLFLDCGHLCCCYECGHAKKHCVICGSRVRTVIKIFKM